MIIFFLFLTGLLAGSFGALLGLGGGAIIIPVMTIFFHLPIHTAIGVSLVGVIATSTGAAIVYVREGKTDIKLGMLLELGTTVGAILGAVIAGLMSARVLYLLFAVVLVYNSYSMYRRNKGAVETETACGQQYRNIPLGIFLSSLAGIMSGLLGLGGGLIKIPVMYLLMGVPLKTAAATSNFMIGVTAAASAWIYFLNGRINPVVTVPVALGIFAGALAGTWANTRISTGSLRKVFILIFIYIAVQMALRGIRG